MPASPSLSSVRATAEADAAEPLRLSEALRSRVALAAADAGVSVAELCEQWLLQGLEQAEQQRALSESAGRCSLRTGACSVGPVPLPVQQ
ncbi:MAG: hypothetical protein VKI83_03565 [Synechococcaceae cyanobacterium]|nr:hypothetical protein [Synechococcaceae cyanobacterium]